MTNTMKFKRNEGNDTVSCQVSSRPSFSLSPSARLALPSQFCSDVWDGYTNSFSGCDRASSS